MIAIRFDGPPSHESGRFIEVERDGVSISFGEWKQDGDDWLLELTQVDEMERALKDIAGGLCYIPDKVLKEGRTAVASYMWTWSQERARTILKYKTGGGT